MNTSRKLSKREGLDKLSWPILIFLLVVLPSFLANMTVGLILTTCTIFICWKFYSKDEITDEDIKFRKNLSKMVEKIILTTVSSLVALGAAVAIFGANDQQKNIATEYKIDSSEFLKFACHTKSTCKNYAESRLSCAEAGNINECIKIKMRGEEFSSCTDDGSISDLSGKLVPTSAQCIGNAVALLFK